MKLTDISDINKMNEAVKENRSPLSAIRLKCLDCSGYDRKEIRECQVTDCPLYQFREGKNPFSKRRLSDEQRQRRVEQLKEFREMRHTK